MAVFDYAQDVSGFCELAVDSLTAARSADYEEICELMERVLGKPLRSLPVIPVWLDYHVSDNWGLDRQQAVRYYQQHVERHGLLDNPGQAGLVRLEGGESDGEDYDEEVDELADEDDMEEDEENSDDEQTDGTVGESAMLVNLLSDIHEVLSCQPREGESVMRITRFTLSPISVTVHERSLAVLASIRDLGIDVTSLPSVCLNLAGGARQDALRSMRSLFDVNRNTEGGVLSTHRTRSAARQYLAASVPGVEQAALKSLGANFASDIAEVMDLIPSVFSGIQASTSLRSIHIDFKHIPNKKTTADDAVSARRRMLWWATYGLFCRAPLDTIDISAERLSPADVESMAQMWNASNPFSLLFPGLGVGSFGAVIASNLYLQDPCSKKAPTQWHERSPNVVEVLGEQQQGFVPVLVPGWGKAWVKHKNSKIDSLPATLRSAFQSPMHLLLRRVTSHEAALSLLQLVGRDLNYLTICDTSFSGTRLAESFSDQVLSSCPHLEELEIPGMTHLEPFMDAIRSGRCANLRRLYLKAAHFSNDEELLLYEVLTNPRDAVAKQLRKLRYHIMGKTQRPVLVAVLKMLRTNTRLRHFDLVVECDEQLIEEFDPLFEPLRFARAVEPLPLPSVLAFLSATHGEASPRAASDTHKHRQELLQQFDSRILSLVVSFAGSVHVRSANVDLRGPQFF